MLGLLLEGEGYRVILAENGAAALGYLHCNPAPCCILLDVWMPRIGGLAFHQAQQQDPDLAEIPVIGVSAQRRGAYLLAELGVTAYLEKPFMLDQLLVLLLQTGC